MALVSGQGVSSFAELNTKPANYADLSAAEDSDDEYVYVSSLAEEIAHALMLDDDDEPPSNFSQPSPSLHSELWHQQGTGWPSTGLLVDQEFDTRSAEMIFPVSNFAAAWRDHGPSEWDCFYTPSLPQASKQLSTVYTSQLEIKCSHLSRGWSAACLANNSRGAAECTRRTWDLRQQEAHSTSYNSASLARKESIGTGVFLPKIVNSGPHYRRKAGFSSSKSAFAPRHKC